MTVDGVVVFGTLGLFVVAAAMAYAQMWVLRP